MGPAPPFKPRRPEPSPLRTVPPKPSPPRGRVIREGGHPWLWSAIGRLFARLGMAIGWLCSRLSRSVDNGDPPPFHVECVRCSGTHHFNGRSWEACAGCGAPIFEPKPLPPEGLVPLEVFWR